MAMEQRNAIGINLGQILANAETIKTVRLRRGKMERDEANEKNALRLRKEAVAGDRGAFERLAVIDPQGAAQLKRTLDGLRGTGGRGKGGSLKQAKQNAERIGEAAAFVLNSKDPASAYATVMASMPEEVRATMPPEYNQKWMELQLVRAMGVDDYLSRLDDKAEAEAEASSPEALASSASNSIWRQTAALYGGLYDPSTGEVTGLRGTESKVNAVAAEAERIMQAEGLSAAQAVQKANEKVGGEGSSSAPNAGNGASTDLPEGFVLD